MVTLTEKKAILILFKDFTDYYNANSLSKKLGISRIGTMKMLKKFEKDGVLISKRIGKAIIYKVNLKDDYVRDLISFLLSDEANGFKRWKDEFRMLFRKDRIVLFYGSVLKDYSKARDIDVMVIRKKGESKEVYGAMAERQKFISKKIHLIDLSLEEFGDNLKQNQKAIVDIVRSAVVLNGQAKYVGLIKSVTNI